MWNVNDALSRGWSFAGNHDDATWGSPTTIAPSPVWMTPEPPKSDSVGGTPSYRATIGEVRALRQAGARLDDQLLILALERRGRAVDRQRSETQPHEVEVELAEIVSGPRLDGGHAGHVVRRRVVPEREVVVADVVAAVAVEREVW